MELIRQIDIDESPTFWKYTGTGRARCRICGEKIEKGADGFGFYASLTDASYNSWTAVECKAHSACVTDEALARKLGRAGALSAAYYFGRKVSVVGRRVVAGGVAVDVKRHPDEREWPWIIDRFTTAEDAAEFSYRKPAGR